MRRQFHKIVAVRGIEDLVLAGIATGGVVLATVAQAADLDYSITVLSDACADPDPDLHDTLTKRVFTRCGDVIDTADWAYSLGRIEQLREVGPAADST